MCNCYFQSKHFKNRPDNLILFFLFLNIRLTLVGGMYIPYALYIEGQGAGRFGQGTGQGQLKLKKKCRYKLINCQACRNPNLLETKNFHFFAFSAHSLSRWKRRVLARSRSSHAARGLILFFVFFCYSTCSLVYPSSIVLASSSFLASAWFRFSFVLHNCTFYVTGYTTASGWCWRLRKGAEAAAG
jgi:hypothetical protein